MKEITFQVTPCGETGGYVARWDDAGKGGIATQGDTLEELNHMVEDAVKGYFEPGKHPRVVRLHFVEDPALVLT
jgi:predicted RNase H-like HicB family nuclease